MLLTNCCTAIYQDMISLKIRIEPLNLPRQWEEVDVKRHWVHWYCITLFQLSTLNPIPRHFCKLYENIATLYYSALPCTPFPIKNNFVRLNTFHVFPRPIQCWWNFDDRIWEMSHFWSIGSDWDQADFVTFDDISWCTKKFFFFISG